MGGGWRVIINMVIHRIFLWVWSLLSDAGVSVEALPPLTTIAMTALMFVVLASLYRLMAGPIARYINKRVDKSNTKVDDLLLSPKIVGSLCLLIVVGLGSYVLPRLCVCYPSWRHHVEIACRVGVIASIANVLLLEINAFCTYLRHGESPRAGILVLRNILQTIVGAAAGLLIISTLMDRELSYVISALGAMAAVLMLVFKDSILGMIAGIRLTLNGMLHENDWVTVPSYNADGRVEDVSLTAVKIRNWDKSVSTIPPHAMVSEGFVNRQSMLSLDVRQIRRSIYIDATSVRRLDDEERAAVARRVGMTLSPEMPSVNLSLFRRHVRRLLLDHPLRAKSRGKHPFQVMVRELAPTPEGIPVELFLFVKCLDWEEFEELQGDLMDEVTSLVSAFDLRLYQRPSGHDVTRALTVEELAD